MKKSHRKAHPYCTAGVYVIHLEMWSQLGTLFLIDGPEEQLIISKNAECAL